MGYSRTLGTGVIKSRALLGTYVPGSSLAARPQLCGLRQDSSLSESWFSPLQNKDINFLPSNYPIGLLWEIIQDNMCEKALKCVQGCINARDYAYLQAVCWGLIISQHSQAPKLWCISANIPLVAPLIKRALWGN